MARKKKNKPLRLYLFLSLGGILILYSSLTLLHRKESPENREEEKQAEAQIQKPFPEAKTSPSELKENRISIPRGSTFTDIMSSYNLSPLEIHRMREEAKALYDLAKIKAGHEIRIHCSKEGTFKRLEYDIDEDRYLLLVKDGENYRAEIKDIPYKTEVGLISGTVEDNLITAVNKEGEENYLALFLADRIFPWDIDFYTDPRPGDTFKILFEKKYLRGEFVGYGKIIAAEYVNQGKKFQAFYYSYPGTNRGDYYDAEGNSLEREFLKSPIPFSRITSFFSLKRLHPIRKIYRPHFGVDYAARIGTPVQATAEGTVTYAGWNGAAGYMVKIRHKNGYETLYLHLHPRKRAPGIRKGAKVRQGQTIGYVGSSGESTGPHLDYRIKHRGRYLNPLAQKFKPVAPLSKEYIEDFRRKVVLYSLVLEKPLELISWMSHLFTLLPLPPLETLPRE
ncbi:MAG: M23 family metallopeptidase [Candidatus Aminicenantales bacterium]